MAEPIPPDGLPASPPMPPHARHRFRVVALVLLVAGGAALAAWAFRSVAQTASTEVERGLPESPRPSQPVGPGTIAPLFAVPSYDGRGPVRLAAFRGHLVLLNFWASWCAPCRAEAPTLESTYLKYKDRGVQFVGVDLQNDTWSDSRAFLREFHITYPTGRDDTGIVGRAYRVSAIPTSYFVSPDGRILTIAITGGFTGADGVRDLTTQIEKWLHVAALSP